MSVANEQDQVIVIHPPLSGEAHAVADVIKHDNITTVFLPDPATLPGTRIPSASAHTLKAPGTTVKAATNDRAVGVDAFRGFFLLLMTFAMAIPEQAGMFPQWMYHMQYPPPGEFVNRFGLAWRDITFPAFLFTMCAAIPITNSLRLSKGMSYPGVLWLAVKRYALLFLYALIIGHVNPYWTHDYTKRGNLVAIAGFLVMWPVFLRKPAGWSDEKFGWFKKAGYAAAAAILFLLPRAYGMNFSVSHIDDIIHALAFVSLVTIPLWLFTQNNTLARLAVLGGAIAFKLGNDTPGVFQDFVNNHLNGSWLFEPWMIELLIIAVPGTIAGDMIVRWMRKRDDAAAISWPKARLAALAALCFAFAPVAVVGYYNHYALATGLTVAVMSVAGLLMLRGAVSDRERILASLFRWAAVLMVLGTIVEPIGGGIRKDPQTLSYLVFMSGLSLSLLTSAILVVDVLKPAPRATNLLVQVGQNPLLAYVCYMLFFNHISWVTNTGNFFVSSTAAAVFGCVLFTSLTGALSIFATRRKLFWRA